MHCLKKVNTDLTASNGGNHQYKIGKKYTVKGKLKMCGWGFHVTPNPDEWIGTRIFIARTYGKTILEDNKAVCRSIRLIRELNPKEKRAYDKAIAPARKAYYKTIATAEEAYYKTIATAEEAYYKTIATAKEAYYKTIATAEEAYEKAIAPAEEAYYKTIATAEEAYEKAIATAKEAHYKAISDFLENLLKQQRRNTQ